MKELNLAILKAIDDDRIIIPSLLLHLNEALEEAVTTTLPNELGGSYFEFVLCTTNEDFKALEGANTIRWLHNRFKAYSEHVGEVMLKSVPYLSLDVKETVLYALSELDDMFDTTEQISPSLDGDWLLVYFRFLTIKLMILLLGLRASVINDLEGVPWIKPWSYLRCRLLIKQLHLK